MMRGWLRKEGETLRSPLVTMQAGRPQGHKREQGSKLDFTDQCYETIDDCPQAEHVNDPFAVECGNQAHCASARTRQGADQDQPSQQSAQQPAHARRH